MQVSVQDATDCMMSLCSFVQLLLFVCVILFLFHCNYHFVWLFTVTHTIKIGTE